MSSLLLQTEPEFYSGRIALKFARKFRKGIGLHDSALRGLVHGKVSARLRDPHIAYGAISHNFERHRRSGTDVCVQLLRVPVAGHAVAQQRFIPPKAVAERAGAAGADTTAARSLAE